MAMELPLTAGRTAFGADPEGYEAARPPYPAALFDLIETGCGIRGARLFEIGPGTGLATRELLSRGPAIVTAVEPDPRLARHLSVTTDGYRDRLSVTLSSWEDAALADEGYDLGLAATSFHWLEQRPALKKVRHVLRPGGWWAMWWTVFGDPDNPDDFHRKASPLFRDLPVSPSWRTGRRPFALDRESRLADMRHAGFDGLSQDILRWTVRMDSRATCALTATFSQVVSLTPDARTRFLSALKDLVQEEFGGSVERRFVTVLYRAQRPKD